MNQCATTETHIREILSGRNRPHDVQIIAF